MALSGQAGGMNAVASGGMPTTPLPEAPSADAQICPFRPGLLMFSRFLLDRLLGRGEVGEVWLAHDRELDRQVALKFIDDEFLSEPAARDDLKRATRRAVDLGHPNVISNFGFFE